STINLPMPITLLRHTCCAYFYADRNESRHPTDPLRSAEMAVDESGGAGAFGSCKPRIGITWIPKPHSAPICAILTRDVAKGIRAHRRGERNTDGTDEIIRSALAGVCRLLPAALAPAGLRQAVEQRVRRPYRRTEWRFKRRRHVTRGLFGLP